MAREECWRSLKVAFCDHPRSPVAVAGHPFDGYAGHESGWRVVHRWEPHVWPDIGLGEPLEKFWSAALDDAAGAVNDEILGQPVRPWPSGLN